MTAKTKKPAEPLKKPKKAPAKPQAKKRGKAKAESKQTGEGASPVPGGEKPKNLGGRPTKYRPEFPQMLIDYFDKAKAGYKVVNVPAGEGREKIEVLPEDFPTFEEFAADIGVSRETLHSWAHDKDKDGRPLNPLFSDAYARARARQTAILVKGGMAGAFDARFAGLAAKNLAGWADKLEQTVDDVSGFSPDEIAEREEKLRQMRSQGVWTRQREEMKGRAKALGEAPKADGE